MGKNEAWTFSQALKGRTPIAQGKSATGDAALGKVCQFPFGRVVRVDCRPTAIEAEVHGRSISASSTSNTTPAISLGRKPM